MVEKLKAFGRALVRSWQFSLAWGALEIGALIMLTAWPGLWWVPLVWFVAALYVGYRAAVAETNDLAPLRVCIVGHIIGAGVAFGCWSALAHRGIVPPPADGEVLLCPLQALGKWIGNPFLADLVSGVPLLIGVLAVGAWGKDRALALAYEREREARTSS